MPTFGQIRTALELLYFVSGAALAGIAAFGLQQIKLLKQDIQIRNERAAKEQAIAASERFIKSTEASAKYLDGLKAAGLKNYTGPIGDFTVKSLSEEAHRGGLKKYEPLVGLWLPDLNELEGLAAAYMSGVADEQLGFTILGIGYCRSVEQKYDVICLHRGDGSAQRNYWKNTIALYRIWSERAKREGLLKSLDQLNSQLRDSPAVGVKPIGLS